MARGKLALLPGWMVLGMARGMLALLLLLLFVPAAFGEVLDSDNDNVSDTQELIDGTDPNNAEFSLLEVRIEGSLVVGGKIEASLVHPALGRIKHVDFTLVSRSDRRPLNSGPSGVVGFPISSAGRHLLEARKGAFSRSVEFYPECAVFAQPVAELSQYIFLLSVFLSAVISALTYTGFRRLLLATEADYPLRKYPVIVPAYVGASLFVIMLWLCWVLGQLRGMIALFLCLVVLLVVLWAFRAKGMLKQLPKKPLPKKAGKAVKGLVFIPLLFAALAEKLKGRKKAKPEKDAKMSEMLNLKRDISESIARVEEAKKKSASAGEKRLKQEALNELSEEVNSFNTYVKRMLGLKGKKVDVKKVEREKSLSELRKEKRQKIMAEDLLDQMAREMDVFELPEGEAEPEKGKEKKRGRAAEKLSAIFIGKKKGKKLEMAGANVEIAVSDEFGNPLDASMAEFFKEGKKIQPVFLEKNIAGFKLKEGEHQLFIRVMGFTDSFLEIEASKEKRSFKAALLAGLKLVITDEKDAMLKDAFVTIVDEHGKKVEDSLKNVIWRSPRPGNAPDGVIAIPLNPKALSFESFKVRVVRANYSQKEEIVQTSRISTQKVFEKKVQLERIKK